MNKINIHFIPTNYIVAKVKHLNQILVNNGSEINFKRIHRPHITIVMGELRNGKTVEDLYEPMMNISKNLNSFPITLSKPYLVQKGNTYWFMDIQPERKIIDFKIYIYQELTQLIMPDKFGVPENKPHLTLGYTKNVSKNILDNTLYPKNSVIKEIGISIKGKRGTCLKRLKRFKLNKAGNTI